MCIRDRNSRTTLGRCQGKRGHSRRASTLELRQNFQGLQNEAEAGDNWIHNANLTWAPDSGKYEVSAWINNITDTYNYNSGFMHGIWQFDFSTVDRPREYGVTFKAKF